MFGRSDNAVRGLPLLAVVPQPSRGERTLQLRAELVEIARPAFRAVRPVRQQRRQCRQVVLEIVDGGGRIQGGGARERRPAGQQRPLGDGLRRGNVTLDGPRNVEHIERRHAGPGLVQLDSRERHVQSFRRSTHRKGQLQALVGGAARLRGESGVRGLAPAIGQQRVFADALWEHPLSQAWHEHDLERTAAGRARRTDEDAAMAATGRLVRQRGQPGRQHVANLAQADRADRRERRKLAQHADDAFGFGDHPRRQALEGDEPFTPRLRRGPVGHLGQDGFRKRSEGP